MKTFFLSILVFLFLFKSNKIETKIAGIYNSKNCNVLIELTNHRANYEYHLKTKDRDEKGNALIQFDRENKGYIIELKKSKMFEPSKKNITLFLQNDTITIQNFGNSMNEYQQLISCEEKFIVLTKQKKKG